MTDPLRTSVQTRALTKRYGPILAVDRVDLSVRRGEVYGFLGPNGAGKTTTLRMILGLARPTSGSVRLFGTPPGRDFLDRVGALVEGPAFYPYLSGRDNLRVLARHAGAAPTRVGEVLEAVDLTDRSRHRYATYSQGMKQRLGLAAALLKDPDLLILDEPTNGLDPAGMAEMRHVVRRLADQGRTVLLSSHLLAEVRQVCDRVGVISRGRLVAESPVGELGTGGRLRIAAEPVADAFSVVASMAGPGQVRRVDGAVLEVDVDRSLSSRVNSELVRAGLSVSELRWVEPDLEQAFLSLTGGLTEGADHVG